MATQKKIQIVEKLTEKAQKAKSIVFAEYKGIKHKQLEELRKKLKKAGSELVVAKNTLLLRSLANIDDTIQHMLTNDTAAVFNYNDEVTGVKELVTFFKSINLGKTKGGMLGAKPLTAQDVTRLASLPSKEVLIGKLVGNLHAPLYALHHGLTWNINKLVWSLSAVKDKKQ